MDSILGEFIRYKILLQLHYRGPQELQRAKTRGINNADNTCTGFCPLISCYLFFIDKTHFRNLIIGNTSTYETLCINGIKKSNYHAITLTDCAG